MKNLGIQICLQVFNIVLFGNFKIKTSSHHLNHNKVFQALNSIYSNSSVNVFFFDFEPGVFCIGLNIPFHEMLVALFPKFPFDSQF